MSGDILIVDSCRCDEPSCPRWKGLIRDQRGFWRHPTLDEIRIAVGATEARTVKP
jgi:hypothetical protein